MDPNFECKNGGQCVPRVLGDYVCSCPQPYCGLTCSNIGLIFNLLTICIFKLILDLFSNGHL